MDFSFIADEELRVKAETAHAESMKVATADIEAKIDAAVQGLKAKNDELLTEKKSIQARLQEFSEIPDPKLAKEAFDFFQKSTEAQMIKEGRTDELIQMKTAQFRADTEAKMRELEGKLTETASTADTYKNRFEAKMVEDTLREAAIRAGVIPSAVSDVLLRGGHTFSLGQSGEVEARDHTGKLMNTKDGKILTPENWVAELKEQSPHYWPPSKSGGFSGSGGVSDDDIQARLADLAKNDQAGYRALRAKIAAQRKK